MKKRILPVAVLLIVALAVFLPQLLYYYSDTSYLNQVKYSDKDTGSVNFEMASTAKTKTIDQKLEDLNSIITDEEYAKMWEESKNNLGRIEPDEQLKELGLITEKGEYVRSKSEKIIADTLTKNNINYVYELPLRLKGYGTVKPDFTVLNKRTRHEYVWEHFGMMDDSIYVKNAIKKIEQYGKSGYVQGRNFIATFESKEAPLNTVTINRVIQDFFQ